MAKVSKIIRLDRTSDGSLAPTVLYSKRGYKGSPALQGVERLVHDFAEASATFETDYLRRHEAANGKKQNGWLRQFDKNLVLAMAKGRKKLPRVFRLY
jgi:hypothetical protein